MASLGYVGILHIHHEYVDYVDIQHIHHEYVDYVDIQHIRRKSHDVLRHSGCLSCSAQLLELLWGTRYSDAHICLQVLTGKSPRDSQSLY